ncbi:DUF5783 family protein [Halorientalis sp.]|jgi:hypothetical protein|uniref:DUF5783 family protein n=1 Tax=Halorientalis sp. TaxID=1931229 RepID=UPI00260397A2|nr:DUF5783 family protein [Halorientalis sp.]
MADFDPEQFEDKYANYFTELQRAYKNAFETMNDRYDSELVHAIDQFVLSESEPFYEGTADQGSADGPSGQSPREHDGQFRIELPEDPYDRLQGVIVAEEQFDEVMDRYLDEIETELQRVFGLDTGE